MKRCSKEAFARCPLNERCGAFRDASYMEGSECDAFNQAVLNRPRTNADQIRTMSDRDLAEWICNTNSVCECCAIRGKCEEPYNDFVCTKNVLEWLQQPAEV